MNAPDSGVAMGVLLPHVRAWHNYPARHDDSGEGFSSLPVTSIFLLLTEAVFFDLLNASFLWLVYKTGLPQRQTVTAQLAHLSCFRENCSHNPCGFFLFFFSPFNFFFCLGNGLRGYGRQLDFKAGEFRCALPGTAEASRPGNGL